VCVRVCVRIRSAYQKHPHVRRSARVGGVVSDGTGTGLTPASGIWSTVISGLSFFTPAHELRFVCEQLVHVRGVRSDRFVFRRDRSVHLSLRPLRPPPPSSALLRSPRRHQLLARHLEAALPVSPHEQRRLDRGDLVLEDGNCCLRLKRGGLCGGSSLNLK
jgi:hypothetical protein